MPENVQLKGFDIVHCSSEQMKFYFGGKSKLTERPFSMWTSTNSHSHHDFMKFELEKGDLIMG